MEDNSDFSGKGPKRMKMDHLAVLMRGANPAAASASWQQHAGPLLLGRNLAGPSTGGLASSSPLAECGWSSTLQAMISFFPLPGVPVERTGGDNLYGDHQKVHLNVQEWVEELIKGYFLCWLEELVSEDHLVTVTTEIFMTRFCWIFLFFVPWLVSCSDSSHNEVYWGCQEFHLLLDLRPTS